MKIMSSIGISDLVIRQDLYNSLRPYGVLLSCSSCHDGF